MQQFALYSSSIQFWYIFFSGLVGRYTERKCTMAVWCPLMKTHTTPARLHFFPQTRVQKGMGVCVCVRLWVLVLDYLMHYKLIHIFLLVQFVCVCSVCEYVCVVFIKLLTFTFNRNLPAPIFFALCELLRLLLMLVHTVGKTTRVLQHTSLSVFGERDTFYPVTLTNFHFFRNFIMSRVLHSHFIESVR